VSSISTLLLRNLDGVFEELSPLRLPSIETAGSSPTGAAGRFVNSLCTGAALLSAPLDTRLIWRRRTD
jgi:hypothetical protein